MAVRQSARQPGSVEAGKLSVEAAQFYARVYESARTGCAYELRRAGCSDEEAEELFAASFEKVMRTVDPIARHFAAPQMVKLMKVACRRRLIDERRHQALIRHADLGEAGSLRDPSAASPEEVAEGRELVAIGREALFSLPARERLVFRQRHELGLSSQEIQRNVPGLTARSYRKTIQRANARVLEAFERIEGGERCEEMEARLLRRFVGGQASSDERELIEAHLERCRACRLTHARMRGYLHDVASSLALAASSAAHGGLLGEGLARLAGSGFLQGGHAVVGATRAVRERAREAALRVVAALQGSGGDAAVAQVVGSSGMKIASMCAAGAAAATCLAAGVVPGVGGIGLLAHHRSEGRQAASAAKRAPPAVGGGLLDTAPALPTAGAPAGKASRSGAAARRRAGAAGSVGRSGSRRSSQRPFASAAQTGSEFGFESGSALPPPSPARSPSSSSTSGGGADATTRRSSGGGGSGGSGGAEFGL